MIRERLKNNPHERASVRKLKSIWDVYHPETNSANRIWKLTSKKLHLRQSQRTKITKVSSWWKYAAAAMLVLSIGLNAYYFINRNNPHSTGIPEYTAKTGEVKLVNLPDGSKVWLNSKSTLILQSQFNEKTRNVFLIGEAFFEVTKNPQKPFLVNTSDLTVRVLGTSFSVSNYQNDPDISTCLLEGSVELQSKADVSKSVILSPSESATLNKSNGEITVKNKPENLIAPWREGRFRFYNHNLRSIAHQLERKFDCEFIFVDEAAESLRFTGDFETKNLDEILELLNKAHSFKLKKEGRRYIISL